MSTFKCKMCGGALEIQENATVAICEYCGTQQTLPRLGDDRRANLYDRANHFRRNNDFDKAMGIYEQILNDDPSDAEAYWSIVLCRYGIEYVEDPSTHKRVPTINRAQFTSVFDDDNYKSALKYADGSQRGIYEDEARTINEIQKGILAISQKEEPFDVFICYKESDNGGRRTPDSVLATELYHELTREGFKVFFSRITLEDKLGVAYEPYIFAALNSAKVMVVLGTKQEYFNAVWVKNEWSRYLGLIKGGARKILIPAYRDMDPYDLPDEFSHLQAQDMSKLGFMQDLIRGIKKIVEAEAPKTTVKETVVVQQSAPTSSGNIVALLKRGNMALEDGEWDKADGFFEEVLNQDAECAEAYLGKTLAAERCATLDTLIRKRLNRTIVAEYEEFSLPLNPERARIASEKYFIPNYFSKETIIKLYEYKPHYANCITSRKAQKAEEERWWSSHKQLSRAMRFASGDAAQNISAAYAEIMEKLDERIASAEAESIRNKADAEKKYADFLDAADAKAVKMQENALSNMETDYQMLCAKMDHSSGAEPNELIAKGFDNLLDYKNSKELSQICRDRANAWRAECKAEEERQRIIDERNAAVKRAKTKKIRIIAAAAAVVIIAAAIVITQVIIPNGKYNDAVTLMENGQYEEAIAAFEALDGYKDSRGQINNCETAIMDINYSAALTLMESGQYEEAIAALEALNGYKDSVSQINSCKTAIMDINYSEALTLMDSGQYIESIALFDSLGDYNGANIIASELRFRLATKETISTRYKHTVGVKSDGTVVAVGYNHEGQCDVSDWTDIVAVSIGNEHTVGLKSNGTVVATGTASDYDGAENWTDIAVASAGAYHTIGLKSDGTVVAVGNNQFGQCDVDSWTDIVAIDAGGNHTIGLKSDGTVVAVGNNRYKQCNVDDWTDIVAISACSSHTVGLKSDGTVVAVGYNEYKQCNTDSWTDIVAIFAGGGHTVGLKSDGTVVAVGYNQYKQCNVDNWTDIIAVGAGVYHTVALKSDGTVISTGDNEYGQCDCDGWTDIMLP